MERPRIAEAVDPVEVAKADAEETDVLERACRLLFMRWDPADGSQDGGYPGHVIGVGDCIVCAGEGYGGTDLEVYRKRDVIAAYRMAVVYAREQMEEDGEEPDEETLHGEYVPDWFPLECELEECGSHAVM